MAWYGLCFRANTSSLALSTPVAVLDLYIITTHLSRMSTSLSFTVATWGYWLNLAETSEASAPMSWVCHADFFPLPRKAVDTSLSSQSMNSTKRVLHLSWCVKISSAALGWAMSFVSNESRSLLSSLKGLPIYVCENLEQFIYSLKKNLWRFWCLFVMVRMYNSLLGFESYLALGNELADFGTSYHPPSQC